MQKPFSSVPSCLSEGDDPFEVRLAHHCGFSLARHKPLASDQTVIRPRQRSMAAGREESEQVFLTFFDDARFRTLVRCLLRRSFAGILSHPHHGG
jgi:hypothetical protein